MEEESKKFAVKRCARTLGNDDRVMDRKEDGAQGASGSASTGGLRGRKSIGRLSVVDG